MRSRGTLPADPAAFLLLVTALVMPKAAEPDTECRTCWEAEAPWIVKVRDQFGIGRSPTYVSLSSTRTWYERHRADYERTGETKHLDRMLRHVPDADITGK